MIESTAFNQFAAADDHCDTKRTGGVMMTRLAISLRGLLVTTTAVGIVAYLLLTNSHIWTRRNWRRLVGSHVEPKSPLDAPCGR